MIKVFEKEVEFMKQKLEFLTFYKYFLTFYKTIQISVFNLGELSCILFFQSCIYGCIYNHSIFENILEKVVF